MPPQNQMSDKNSFAIWMKVFIVATFAIDFTVGIQTCFDKNIRQFCDCSYFPTFEVQCSYKRLKEYPDFQKIQVTTLNTSKTSENNIFSTRGLPTAINRQNESFRFRQFTFSLSSR